MANTRLFQILGERELQPAVATSTILSAANATVDVKDPKFDFNVEEYERELNSGNLSPQQAITGKISATVSFAVEMSGTSTAATAPPWAKYMEACGFRLVPILGAIWGDGTTTSNGLFGGTATGTAKHAYTGQLWQTASAAKVIRIIHDTYEGQDQVFYEAVTGSPASADVYWPTTSDVTVGPLMRLDAGQPGTQKGFALVPTSQAISTVTTASGTGTNSLGHIFVGGTSGAVIEALEAITDGTLRKFRILDGVPTSTGETFTNKTGTGSFATSSGTWAQTDFPSLTIALAEDGTIKIAKGCRGTVSISAEPGQPTFLNFTFTGLLSSIQDGTAVTGVTRVSKVPPKLQGVDCKVGGFVSTDPGFFNHATAHSPKLLGFTIDLGATAAVEGDATQSTGVTGAANQTGRRASQGTLKVGNRPEASFPFLTKQRDSEPFWLKMRWAQNTSFFANNVFLLSTPGCVITGSPGTDADGYSGRDLGLRLSSRKPDGTDGEGGEIVLSYHYSASTTW